MNSASLKTPKMIQVYKIGRPHLEWGHSGQGVITEGPPREGSVGVKISTPLFSHCMVQDHSNKARKKNSISAHIAHGIIQCSTL